MSDEKMMEAIKLAFEAGAYWGNEATFSPITFQRLMEEEAQDYSMCEEVKAALTQQPESEPLVREMVEEAWNNRFGEGYIAPTEDYVSGFADGYKGYRPQPSAQVPEEILEIGRRMLADAKDNDHYTADPLFIVEKREPEQYEIGIYGKAYDGPGKHRAYTYHHQPDNLAASKLGKVACEERSGGDSIDHGLSLLRQLQHAGFGVFEVAAAPSIVEKENNDE